MTVQKVFEVSPSEAPKTHIDAVLQIMQAIKDDKLQGKGVCNYGSPGEKPCAIGLFFSDAQRAYLQESSSGSTNIANLKGVIGVENLKAITGMSVNEAAMSQSIFDDSTFFDFDNAKPSVPFGRFCGYFQIKLRSKATEAQKKTFDQLIAPEQIAKAEEPMFTTEMIEAIYAAWDGANVGIAGGNWVRFVSMLPRHNT